MAIRRLWIGSTGPFLIDRAAFIPFPITDPLYEVLNQAAFVFETETGDIIKVDATLEDLLLQVLPVTPSDPGAKFLNGNKEWSNKLGDLTNYVQWDATGHQIFAGNARPWRDELSDSLNIRSTGAGVSVNNAEGVVEFTSTAQIANDYLYLNIQLNHDKDLASSIYPHIHFFQGSNAIPNFLLQYRWQSNGGEKVTGWTSIKCNSLAFPYGGTTKVNIAYSAAIVPPVGASLSDIVQFRVCRDTDNDSTLFTGVDPYAGSVGILAFDLHLMLNSLGSTDEYTK